MAVRHLKRYASWVQTVKGMINIDVSQDTEVKIVFFTV